jgi:hypothetical protein
MFDFTRTALAAGKRHWQPNAGNRSRHCRLKFECLESRCLLFAPLGSFEQFLDLHSLPIPDSERVVAPTHVSLESRSAGVIGPATREPLYSKPLPSPSDGFDHRDWPQLPSDDLAYPPPQLPSIPDIYPDGSSLGGFSDIDELDTQSSPGIFSGGELSKEARQVLELLSALQYVPDARQEISDDLLEALAADLASAAPAASASESSQPLRPQGGMIELARETLVEDRAADKQSDRLAGPPLDVSVTMDVAYGRFQAFEVSTRQPLPPPPACPVQEEWSSPHDSPTVTLPSPLNNPPPDVPPDTTDATHESHPMDQLSEDEISTAPVLDTSWEITNRVIGVTAAAALVAYAAHSNAAASARDPDRRPTLTTRLSTWFLWPVTKTLRLITPRNRQCVVE